MRKDESLVGTVRASFQGGLGVQLMQYYDRLSCRSYACMIVMGIYGAIIGAHLLVLHMSIYNCLK